MKPLLMMRAKGLTGPLFAKHAGIFGLSKSVGNSIGGVRAIAGWGGSEDCAGNHETNITIKFSGDITYTNALTGINITSTSGVFTSVSAVGTGTDTVVYTGTWDVALVNGDKILWSYDGDVGDYVDEEDEPLVSQTFGPANCVALLLEVLSYKVVQIETPNGSKVIRSAVIEVQFNQAVTASGVGGITATVHGAEQVVSLSGSGTAILKYTLQRAIFRHSVTWAYSSALGNIQSGSGELLGDVAEQIVINLLPEFTVWDYNVGALDANTDTTWDGDETRFDEDT